MQRKRLAVALAVVALAALVANAAVFVYYPAYVNVQAQKAPVKFAAGTNAGQPDINGNTIVVTVQQNGTEATLTLHPTLEYNYYYDILRVVNQGQQAYYVNFYINTSNITSIGITEVYIVVNGTKYLAIPGQVVMPQNVLLNANQQLIIGILFYSPDDAVFNLNATGRMELFLIYSPVNEAPQPLP